MPAPVPSPLPPSRLLLSFAAGRNLPRYARKISGTTALQEALKEKQQHIEQLLAERDLEQAEVAKATSHVGEIEQEVALARDGHDQKENFSEVSKATVSVHSSLQETVHKLHQKEEQFDVLSIEMDRLRRTLTVMETKFKERGKREEQLVKAKAKLEAKIADIVKMSGDHSSQLTLMNNELRKRDRCVEELQLQLMKANEQSSLLKDSIWGISMKAEETEQEMRRVYQEELKQMSKRMTDMEEQMVASRKQCQVLQATHEQVSAESKARHDEALQELRQQLLQATERLLDAQVENGNLRQELAELKKQADKAQIEFLNSEIVDLQKKNEDLKMKVEMMSEAALNGGTEDLNNYNSDDQDKQARKKPHLFCDICDCFELHDTKDCPTQAQMAEDPPHSTHHGKRSEEQPYCDIGEVLSHWPANCNDDETS